MTCPAWVGLVSVGQHSQLYGVLTLPGRDLYSFWAGRVETTQISLRKFYPRSSQEGLLDAQSLLYLFASWGSAPKGSSLAPSQGRSSLVKSGLAFLPKTVVLYLTRKAWEALRPNSRISQWKLSKGCV